MNQKILYKIFQEEKIIIEYFSGKATWADLVEMKKKEVAEPNYNPNYNIITDIRNANLDSKDINNVHKYLEYLRNNNESVGNRKTAILTDSAEQVIHSELLRVMNNDLPMNFKTVSTIEAAFEWVRLNHNSFLKISKYLEELKTEIYRSTLN